VDEKLRSVTFATSRIFIKNSLISQYKRLTYRHSSTGEICGLEAVEVLTAERLTGNQTTVPPHPAVRDGPALPENKIVMNAL